MDTTSAGVENSTLFLNINPKDIWKIIKKHTFSNKRDTKCNGRTQKHEYHNRIDICYQYPTYFMMLYEEFSILNEVRSEV